MKRNVLLFLLLIVLVGVAWWATQNRSTGTTLSDYEGSFKVPDTTQIGKIFIADRNGQTVTLERQGRGWVVNGSYPVAPSAMEEMLETVSTVEVKFIPPKSMVPNIIKSLGTHGRLVEVYDRQGEKLKAYYVGGVTQDGTGTFFMMEGSDKPFVVTMKYFHGSVSVRYFLDEKDWRDRTVFPFDPSTIRTFSINYPRQRDQSFTLTQDRRRVDVQPYHPLSPEATTPLNEDLARAYLSKLPQLQAEGFQNDHPDRDSISQTLPFCIVTAETKDSTVFTATFHPIIQTDRDGAIILGQDRKPLPIERYHVNTSTGDFIMVQNEPFKKLFWSYGMFFQ